jgi:aminoglycoside 2'-N-acetyltransferase I
VTPPVHALRTDEVPSRTLGEIRRLMDEAFEGDFGDDDWDHTLGGWHAVVSDGGVVVAHAAVVARTLHVGDRAFRTGYVEGVATSPGRQRAGLGSLAMAAVDEIIRRDFELGGLGTGEWAFYEQLGWERWQGETFVRTGGGLVRTEDDDDGVMVLRFGPSIGIDLAAPIACEARPGDDW